MSSKAYYAANREQCKSKAKAWRIANRAKVQAANRNWRRNNPGKMLILRANEIAKMRRERYGVTLEQLIDMLFEQNGRCAMCRQFFFRTPCVDHCHITGALRELLCAGCNHGLSFIEDEGFKRLAEQYLEKHSHQSKAVA